MLRIKSFVEKYSSYISDVICTGDMNGARYKDYNEDFWNSDGPNKFLLAIGNHDVYDHNNEVSDNANYGDRAYWATASEKYKKYIEPNIENWNVVQPDNADENGLCYYYKDYDTLDSKLRLVVLDGMAFESTQREWLTGVLDDAKTNGYAVMIAEHFAPINGANDVEPFDTAFTSLRFGIKEDSWANMFLPGATAAVDNFINGGGDFVCWICGHIHYDVVGVVKSHPNQMFIAIGSAKYSSSPIDSGRLMQFKSVDLFNIMSIDIKNKILSVFRIGDNVDNWLRHRKTMTIDYKNRKLISTY